MGRQYPNLGSCESIEPRVYLKGSSCEACEEKATKVQEVQVSYFRGDDKVFTLCGIHAATVAGTRHQDGEKAAIDYLFSLREADKEK